MSACVSNMRQIGTGLMMYVQDYDETVYRALGLVTGGKGTPYDSDSRVPLIVVGPDGRVMGSASNDPEFVQGFEAPEMGEIAGSAELTDAGFTRTPLIPVRIAGVELRRHQPLVERRGHRLLERQR